MAAAASRWRELPVVSFGGGIDLTKHPHELRDDQWSFGDGWLARRGYAEVARPFNAVAFADIAAGTNIIGILQNPFNSSDGAAIVSVSGAGNALLHRIRGDGTVTAITPTAGAFDGRSGVAASAAFLNNTLVLTGGWQSPKNFTLAAWTGGANYTRIEDGRAQLRWDYIAPFKSHVVGGAGGIDGGGTATAAMLRAFGWSAVNDPLTWQPTVANDADNAFLDDVPDGINAVLPVSADRLGLFTSSSVQILAPTGSIPAFTRQELFQGVGLVNLQRDPTIAHELRQHLFGRVPGGIVFYGGDDLYALIGGQLQRIGTGMIDYWAAKIRPDFTLPSNRDFPKPMTWHADLGLLVVPRPVLTNADRELWWWEPATGAWSRTAMPTAPIAGRLGFITSFTGSNQYQRRLWISPGPFDTNGGQVFVEDAAFASSQNTGRTVETKDFTFGSPADTVWVDWIKLDWEPLAGANDALQVDVSAREHLTPPGAVGSAGLTIHVSYTTVGSVSGGSELAVRARGKFFRFRFTNLTGPARIRGFTIRWRPMGSRRT